MRGGGFCSLASIYTPVYTEAGVYILQNTIAWVVGKNGAGEKNKTRGVDSEQFNPDPDPGNHANSDPDSGSR